MHTVELLERAVAAANQHGFAVRYEWLGGSGGGPCEIRGQKHLFIDLALPADEQLEQAMQALRFAGRDALELEPVLEHYLKRCA